MTRKEFIKRYSNILNFPDVRKYPARRYELEHEIKRLADIDKMPYRVALEKIGSVFLKQCLEADPDDNNLRELETATLNLRILIYWF